MSAAALSGFTALGAEVVWTRQLSLLFGASVYTFSLILAVFLAGLGIGGCVGIATRAAADGRASTLGSVQALLAVAIAFGAWAIVNVLPRLAADRAVPAERARDAVAGVRLRRAPLRVRAAAGDDPVGRELPADARARASRDFDRHVARINAINTAGALAGAIAFTLIGIPLLGIARARSRRWSLFAGDRAAPCCWPRRASPRSQRLALGACRSDGRWPC